MEFERNSSAKIRCTIRKNCCDFRKGVLTKLITADPAEEELSDLVQCSLRSTGFIPAIIDAKHLLTLPPRILYNLQVSLQGTTPRILTHSIRRQVESCVWQASSTTHWTNQRKMPGGNISTANVFYAPRETYDPTNKSSLTTAMRTGPG
jgi:hypothetical protein